MANKVDNIKNYAKEIESIEDFPSAVKKMPGMYIGRIGDGGFLTMIKEVYQNSIDEMMKDSSPCNEVSVIFNEDTKEVTIMDNGRGIPFDIIDTVFTNPHVSSNYTKKKGEYSSGLHGVGAKVTNALSEYFIVESYINIPGMCEARRAEFYEGYLNKKGVYKIPNKNGIQGTKTVFKPGKVMGNITVTADQVYNLIMGILYLTKVNSVVNYTAIVHGKSHTTRLENTKGTESILDHYMTTPIVPLIKIFDDTGEKKADIKFTFDINLSQATVIGFSNFCPTSNGTHMNGFVDGVVKFFRDYMNKIYLKDSNSKRKNKISVSAPDIRSTLIGVISVAHLEPIFSGQAKDELSNEDMYDFVKNLTINGLSKWSKTHNPDLLKVCKHLKDLAEIRIKGETEKVKLADKYKSSSLSKGLPDKYTAPNGDEHLELIICEGDSAAGTFKNSRDNKKQGIFPIRGKIKNAMRSGRKESLSNEEVAGILAIIGGGAGTRKFNVDEVKWEKIIFATDADVDGCHIACLLLNMILIHCPELIIEGKIYKAVPPLYGIELSRNKMKYLTDDNDYIEYVQKSFLNANDLKDFKNNTMPKSKMKEILVKNIDYVYEVDNLSKAYSVHPELLELVCILYIQNGADLSSPKTLKQIQKVVNDKFRFVQANVVNGVLNVKGLINGSVNTLYVNDRFLSECRNILLTLASDYYVFTLNGEHVTLYELMNTFEKFKPKNITRYKGLGEMPAHKLAESTLHPDGDRTLIRYTMDSAMKEIEGIVKYEKDKRLIIDGVTVSRHDLV